MTMTADEILEHVRALPYRERLKLVERVVHEAVEPQAEPAKLTDKPPLLADLSDEEFDAFQASLAERRRTLPMRAGR